MLRSMDSSSNPVLPLIEANRSGKRSSLADERLVWKMSDSLSAMSPLLQLSEPSLRKSG